METDALYAALVAFAAAALLTPVAARLARRLGAVDELKERVPIFKREEGEWVRGNVPS